MPAPKAPPTTGPALTIGALSRATGIPVETLRTWERRYGAPRAVRRASGHRVYALEEVGRLRRIARVLEVGHRPSEVLGLSEADLEALLDTAHGIAVGGPRAESPGPDTGRATARPAPAGGRGATRDLLAATMTLDGDALRAALDLALLRRTRVEFLDGVLAPALAAIGRAYEKRTLDIRHEHFAAACVGDFLRALRRRHEPARPARHAGVALLPGDRHELGALMAALTFAGAGWGVVYLGLETPVEQLVALAREAPVDALAVSVSASLAGPGAATALRRVRREMPPAIELVVGGAGAPVRLAGARIFRDFASLDRWLRAAR